MSLVACVSLKQCPVARAFPDQLTLFGPKARRGRGRRTRKVTREGKMTPKAGVPSVSLPRHATRTLKPSMMALEPRPPTPVAHQRVIAGVGYYQKRAILEDTGDRRRGPSR